MVPLLGGAVVALAACTPARVRPAGVDLVELPRREADLYPAAETQQGVTVAVDEITEARRSGRYFGVDFPSGGILPVQIIVSNRSDDRVSVRPADVLLLEGQRVHDPVPVQQAAQLLRRSRSRRGDQAAEEIDRFFEEVALRDRVLAPGETHRGVLFFETETERPGRRRETMLRIRELFPHPTFQLHVVVTTLEVQERLRFGPFAVRS